MDVFEFSCTWQRCVQLVLVHSVHIINIVMFVNFCTLIFVYSTAKCWDETLVKFTVLKILCHHHRHTYTDTVSLPFTVIQKVSLITLLIFDKPIATLSGYRLSGVIEVAYVLVVVVSRGKFTCYLSCFQRLGKHISCLFIIRYTAFLIFHLYAPRAHFWDWNWFKIVMIYLTAVFERVTFIGITKHVILGVGHVNAICIDTIQFWFIGPIIVYQIEAL